MSASIDKEAADGTPDARGVLASWLDDYTAGRCDRADMQASFLEICRRNPEAPWDALALLDQYQRRGRVDVALARSLKSDIAQLVFGVANQTEASTQEARDPALDTTGSRWRKLAAQREDEEDAPGESQGESHGDSHVDYKGDSRRGDSRSDSRFDPTQFRRDFDPMTRPPAGAQQKPSPGAERAIAPRSVLRERYELLTMLGRGSAGTVYKALDRHRAHLADSAQCVALKVLKLNYRQRPDALAELEHEFHQAQSLSHQNIVSMFDLDRDGDTYFLVMELLEGELLGDVLRRLDHRPMARDRALSIVGSVGAALAHAHRRDIVHADLKPRNVMITSTGEVKVLDFGFARGQPLEPWIGEPQGEGQDAPHTPAYASAERVNGQELHASEDVYSLACIAYELLSGQHPYGGRSAPLARAHGREPQRIASLSHRQWSALRTALRWSRAERQIDVMGLISALGCAEVPQQLARPHELVPAETRDAGFGGRKLAIAALLALGIAIAAGLYWSERWLPGKTDVASLPGQDSANSANSAAAEATPAVSPADLGTIQIEKPAESATAVPAKPDATAKASESPAPPPARAEVERAPERASKSAPVAAENAAAKEASAAKGKELIQFDKDTYVATESDGSVTLTVRRTGSTSKEALFRWTLVSNSAEAGKDFADIGPGIERIPAGSRTAVLTIPLVSDAIAENTELFLVELSTVEGGPALGERARAAVILVDDD
jgi:hypothetical protein